MCVCVCVCVCACVCVCGGGGGAPPPSFILQKCVSALDFKDSATSRFGNSNVKSVPNYSPFHGFWQSLISIEICRDCIPALASSCKKQLTGYFVCLLFFLKVKQIS